MTASDINIDIPNGTVSDPILATGGKGTVPTKETSDERTNGQNTGRLQNKTIILIDGEEYDVTSFLDSHPGGPDVLREYHSRDATNAFNEIGHSDEAKELLSIYKRRKQNDEISSAEVENVQSKNAKPSDHHPFSKSIRFMLYIFFPLTFSIVICLTSNTSHYKPGQTFWTDFLNGVPNQNEMGFGLFQIAGKIRTKQFIYPWRSLNPSDVGRALAWIFYGIHQLLTWLIIYLAVRAKEQKHITWTNYRNSYSNAMMIVHLTFATLKFVHSRLFYDGLAYDLPEILTQCSVLVFLIIALIVDMPRRGLFFGKVKSMKWYKQEFKEVAKKYHGFAASFGVVINFWYHPVETTLAHFLGFFYQLLMMVHTSLLFHVDHRNRYWTLFLEVNVLIHGFTTGLIQENSAYLVFLYGFATVFFVTQIWGIPSTRWQSFLTQKKKITKEYIALIVGVLVAYLAFAITNFALEKKIQRLFLLLAIPVAEYGLVLLYYLLFLIGFFVFKKIADTKGWISTAWAWFWGALSTFVVMVVFAIIQKPQGTFEI